MSLKKKVFVAEDNPHFCELYKMALESEGYDVRFATNGREAVEKIPHENPDLVILDVMMPEMDGFEVCKKLRDQPDFALTPIVMLTARSGDEDKIKGYDVGADDYLTKPFSLKVLKARVRAILDRSAAWKVDAAQPIVLTEEVAGPPAEDPGFVKTPAAGLLEALFGAAVPPGANILVMGPLGSGKSFLARSVVAAGLERGEKCMWVCLDDDPQWVRREFALRHQTDVAAHEQQNRARFIDAYSWSGGVTASREKYAVRGALELADLSGLVTEAAAELGQTDQEKHGGWRVVDSITSLLVGFDLSYAQRFISFLARSGHFANVTTFFLVEEGTSDSQVLNNVKYLMDGVLELKNEGGRFLGRVQTAKWGAVNPQWVEITQA